MFFERHTWAQIKFPKSFWMFCKETVQFSDEPEKGQEAGKPYHHMFHFFRKKRHNK